MNYAELTDEQVIEQYNKESRSMSFFNAAEGQSWYQEASAREACSIRRKNVIAEATKRGLELPKGNWLC